jgi:hypothetical protein
MPEKNKPFVIEVQVTENQIGVIVKSDPGREILPNEVVNALGAGFALALKNFHKRNEGADPNLMIDAALRILDVAFEGGVMEFIGGIVKTTNGILKQVEQAESEIENDPAKLLN